ncbi:hypothetical protein N658DRAFT_492873 [Parathielavia hyrcaniae]|uniref:Uncharacterized protein n=1 Tax=Parathielavia hyrcaniae TaxID=113614 RepID=A0AAN6QAL8_9PEZI|nr:hypothetical protein N658DRAFT_492873 [Parathielavia hyrcaniae]
MTLPPHGSRLVRVKLRNVFPSLTDFATPTKKSVVPRTAEPLLWKAASTTPHRQHCTHQSVRHSASSRHLRP